VVLVLFYEDIGLVFQPASGNTAPRFQSIDQCLCRTLFLSILYSVRCLDGIRPPSK